MAENDDPPKKKFRSKFIKAVKVPKTLPAKVVSFEDGKAIFKPIENDGSAITKIRDSVPLPKGTNVRHASEEMPFLQPVSSTQLTTEGNVK